MKSTRPRRGVDASGSSSHAAVIQQVAAMPLRLDTGSADFPKQFRAFLDAKREASADVEQAVRAIIAEVAARGDAALRELSQKFDRVDLGTIGMRVTAAELE